MLVIPIPSPRRSISSLLDFCSFRSSGAPRIKHPTFTFSTRTNTSTITNASTKIAMSISSTPITNTASTTPSSSYNNSRESSIDMDLEPANPSKKAKKSPIIFERRLAARKNRGLSSTLRLPEYTDVLPISTIAMEPMVTEKEIIIEEAEVVLEEKEGKVGQVEMDGLGCSDRECWERMLELQRRYHCYNSARLEAAVEAVEKGWGVEMIAMPSRLCLNLLNEDLRARVESHQLEVRL